MSIRVMVVDNEEHGIAALVELISRVPELVLVDKETDPLSALNKIAGGTVNVDLVFLDVEMPGLNGLELSRLMGEQVLKIFVTSYSHYAVDAFGPSTLDYLTKPIETSKFLRAVQWASERLKERNVTEYPLGNQYFFVRLSPRNVIKLKLQDIQYIKSSDKYLEIFAEAEKPILIKKTLNNMEGVLPLNRFMRIHKSYIINIDYLRGIVGNRIHLEHGQVLEIGSTYMDTVYTRFPSV